MSEQSKIESNEQSKIESNEQSKIESNEQSKIESNKQSKTESNKQSKTESNKQSKTESKLSASDYAKQIADLVLKIQSGKLNNRELRDAKKSLQNIQKLVNDSIESFNNILPDLTSSEKRI
ncbi:hypothetical protein, partial [Acinetobacter pseudolwoffii]